MSNAPSAVAASGSERLPGLDAAKNLAVFSVIVLHCSPWFPDAAAPAFLREAGLWWHLLSRWAVPFFFFASGWFLSQGEQPEVRGRKLAGRCVAAFLIWCLVFAFAPGAVSALRQRSLEPLTTYLASVGSRCWQEPLLMLTEGTFYHLWFLPALAAAALIVGTALRFRVLPVVGGTAVVACAVVAWTNFGMGMPGTWSGLVRKLCFATAFVGAGAWLASRPGLPSVRVATGLAAGGLVLFVIEALWLRERHGVGLYQTEVAVSLLLLSAGVFALACHWRNLPARLAWLTNRRTLGIYALHPAVLLVLSRLVPAQGNWLPAALPFVVYALTFVAVTLLARWRWLAKFV